MNVDVIRSVRDLDLALLQGPGGRVFVRRTDYNYYQYGPWEQEFVAGTHILLIVLRGGGRAPDLDLILSLSYLCCGGSDVRVRGKDAGLEIAGRELQRCKVACLG